jgi:hypothetical protein
VTEKARNRERECKASGAGRAVTKRSGTDGRIERKGRVKPTSWTKPIVTLINTTPRMRPNSTHSFCVAEMMAAACK